jgi:gluconokinase
LLPRECADALPGLVDFDDTATLQGISETSRYYAQWPELRNTRFFFGLGDGACANIGSKCTIPSRIACTVGTSAAARITVKFPINSTENFDLEPGLFCYRINKDYVILGGALTDGGSVVEWISQLLNIDDSVAFENCMLQVEKLIHNDVQADNAKCTLTTVPFLSGERSTGFRSGSTGAVLGITRYV